MLQSTGSQRVGHNLTTGQEQELMLSKVCAFSLQEAFLGRLSGLADTLLLLLSHFSRVQLCATP